MISGEIPVKGYNLGTNHKLFFTIHNIVIKFLVFPNQDSTFSSKFQRLSMQTFTDIKSARFNSVCQKHLFNSPAGIWHVTASCFLVSFDASLMEHLRGRSLSTSFQSRDTIDPSVDHTWPPSAERFSGSIHMVDFCWTNFEKSSFALSYRFYWSFGGLPWFVSFLLASCYLLTNALCWELAFRFSIWWIQQFFFFCLEKA